MTPSAETTTISPGSISRTKVAPMASSAQLSLAKTTIAVQIAHAQGTEAVGIARGDELAAGS